MTALALRLEKYLEVPMTMGAVATLQHLADENGAVLQGGKRLDVVIPAGQPTANSISVDPGHWAIEATLPSGEMICMEVVVPRGEEVAVTLRASEHSPHEWLGLQHLNGNIEGADTLNRLQVYARSLVLQNLPGERTGIDLTTSSSQPLVREASGIIGGEVGREFLLLT